MEQVKVKVECDSVSLAEDVVRLLGKKSENFLPYEVTRIGSEYEYTYDVSYKNKASEIISEPRLDKIRFLLNVARLEEYASKYVFDICPENLFYDRNLIVSVMNRNLGQNESFCEKYKALVYFVLDNTYSYEDYLQGGSDLFAKSKVLSDFTNLTNMDEIRSKLEEMYADRKEEEKTEYVLVKKKTNKARKVLVPVLSVFTALLLILSILLSLFSAMYQGRIIKANEYYLQGDYLNVASTLGDISLENLPYMTKYILAISYLKTADLSQEEKQNELLQINTLTDEIVFDYWISIGRMDYEMAVDIAQRMNSEAHLFYAYLSYRKYVETDVNMSGEEKSNLLNSINNEIDRLTEILNSTNGV